MHKNIVKANKYLYTVIGESASLSMESNRITTQQQEYHIYKGHLLGQRINFITAQSIKGLTPRKELDIIRTIINQLNINEPMVYVTNSNDPSLRSMLLKSKIPFIISDKQMYLPFYGMHFTESFTTRTNEINSFSPASQHLLFSILERKDTTYTLKNLSAEMDIPSMTIYRALEELVSGALLTKQKHGRAAVYHRDLTKTEYWNKAKSFLSNPVSDVKYVTYEDSKIIRSITHKPQENILHAISWDPHFKERIAIHSKDYKKYSQLFKESSYSSPDSVALEIWRYKIPLLDNQLHPLALSLALNNDREKGTNAIENIYFSTFSK